MVVEGQFLRYAVKKSFVTSMLNVSTVKRRANEVVETLLWKVVQCKCSLVKDLYIHNWRRVLKPLFYEDHQLILLTPHCSNIF